MTVRFSSTQERLFIVLASCTTSVLCKSFQRTLVSVRFLFRSASLTFAWDTVAVRKRMQRYGFFVNHQNFWREKLKFYARFNSCLQLKRRIVDAHIISLYARETVLRTATKGCTQQESTADWGKQGKILQEKEGVRYGKGGLEPQKQRFGSTKVKVWQHESKGLALRNINKNYPRRSLRASASTVTSICVGRYEHPRRPLRASASVDADDKSREYEEEKRWGERGKREVRAPFFAFATRSDANAICEYLWI